MVLLLARPLVGLFGEEFVEEGVTPLRIFAVTMAISATFSLSPTYLKFTRQRSKVLKIAVATAIVQFGLLLALVPLWGATGAAIASGTSLSAMVCICTLIVLREVSAR
nr:polysaccharide biosynthesis C-terminal domain-containing protein [Shinella curvata]